jgi:hypothetical protein
MKFFLYYITVIFLISIPASAQNRTRVFDNFDTKDGVQVVTPTVAPIVQAKKDKKPEPKNASKAMNVKEGEGFKSSVQKISYTRLAMNGGRSLGAFTTGDSLIDSYIVDSSKRYNIDPLLIYAQMHQESAFKLKAMSHKGARGLMQLMPATAVRFGVTDIYNPKQNIEAGVKYMRWLIDKFNGDVVLALAGYNAGEGAVMRFGNQIPPYRETQEYVRRISSRYNSITNPNLPGIVRTISNTQAANLENKASAPLTSLEQGTLTVRTADGRMRLVNQ